MKKQFGYVFLGLACCMWLLISFVGFFHLSTNQTAILLTATIVLGEVFFVLSIFFLGKAFFQKIKHFCKVWWAKLIE